MEDFLDDVPCGLADAEPHVVDFDHPESWAEQLTGDVLFSCLGTDFLRMIYTV